MCAGANACMCVFFSSVYMLLFTTFHCTLSVTQRPQLGLSLLFLETACNYVFYFMNVAHKFPSTGK